MRVTFLSIIYLGHLSDLGAVNIELLQLHSPFTASAFSCRGFEMLAFEDGTRGRFNASIIGAGSSIGAGNSGGSNIGGSNIGGGNT